MLKMVSSILLSPLGYKYKCVFVYNYIIKNGNKNIINATFYIGHPKTKPDESCITITIFFPVEDQLVDPSIASLLLVKYYESCSEEKSLPHGEGTVDMMNTAMSFVKQICPFVKEFKLNDASTKICDNGASITLPYFYITHSNKTWYESRFGAHLKEPLYDDYKNDIKRVMNTKLPEFNIFYENHIGNVPASIKKELQNVYIQGDTVKDFFNKLYRKYNKNMGCIILQPWIDKFMKNVGLDKYIVKYDWYVPCDIVPTYPFINTNGTYRVNNMNNSQRRRPWST
jgi:hypothetical protein